MKGFRVCKQLASKDKIEEAYFLAITKANHLMYFLVFSSPFIFMYNAFFENSDCC